MKQQQQEKPLDYDHIVVGAGISGAWAAYHLARRGYKTLMVEQFPIPHSRSSSHGQSRLIRKAYPQPYFREMMDDAYEQWRQLESDTATKLLV